MIVTDHTPQTDPSRYWAKSATANPWAAQDASHFRRFIGGSPIGVFVKLVIVSLMVGALLVWLDIRPIDVFRMISDLFDRLWALGFRSIREFGDYMVAGAMIVVPIWFILRVLSYRGR